jgi:hypothetical protein
MANMTSLVVLLLQGSAFERPPTKVERIIWNNRP